MAGVVNPNGGNGSQREVRNVTFEENLEDSGNDEAINGFENTIVKQVYTCPQDADVTNGIVNNDNTNASCISPQTDNIIYNQNDPENTVESNINNPENTNVESLTVQTLDNIEGNQDDPEDTLVKALDNGEGN